MSSRINRNGHRANGQSDKSTKASLTENFDTELYGANGNDRFAGYDTSIAIDDPDLEMDEDVGNGDEGRLVGKYTASTEQIQEWATGDAAEEGDMLVDREKQAQIASGETDYQKRRFLRKLSPSRDTEKTYAERMQEKEIEREEARVKKLIDLKQKEAITNGEDDEDMQNGQLLLKEGASTPPSKKRRQDDADGDQAMTNTDGDTNGKTSADTAVEAPKKKKRTRWDQGPTKADAAPAVQPPDQPARKSKWDVEAPVESITDTTMQPVMPISVHSAYNAPISDEELDEWLPATGYKILIPPPGYEPLRAPAKRVTTQVRGFMNAGSADPRSMGSELPTEIPGVGELAFFKQVDMKYFAPLIKEVDENELSVQDLKKRKIMRLLLKVKNGTPPMRKTALRQITDNAKSFGAEALFDQILPLLMEDTLEHQERHLLVKVIDRVLYKLDELVRPYTHKILVVIMPLLIDQDYYARMEGREIISNLAKAAGLAAMISTMRPDIDSPDEYVRNTTARAFAVVASALGIPALLPFLVAVCRSKKSWEARHTGVKIIQQIPVLVGCAILPHLPEMVNCIAANLQDEQVKVRTVTALALAALAEASHPYGIESFDPVLNTLWTEARKQRGKSLAAMLKAVGHVIPLMDDDHGTYYTSEIMVVLLREFSSPDEEMRKIVLKVISQACMTKGVTPKFLKDSMVKPFFKSFWVRRMALDKRNYRQLVETTVDLAGKIGAGETIERIVGNLKDDSEAYRKMTVETIEKVVSDQGAADIDSRLEERLVDGILFAFQEQSVEDKTMLQGFSTVATALGERCKPYLPQIVSTILWRMTHKTPEVRQQAADLVGGIASVMKDCEEEGLMIKLSTALYEQFGEEFPEVLGSFLMAMKHIVAVVGLDNMQPPVGELIPRLTPILRNRQEKVQEAAVELVGRIADRGADTVSSREWMRVVHELLDMLKAHKKGIRRAANNAFGYIAKAIGPAEVMATLLNNFRSTERQSRVCSAVALGIVAETCAPYTVLPAILNEYRVPELNVQNGVVKALAFMFEYIGEMSKDYVYSVVGLLEDALIDRDQVHRQTAATVTKFVALGCVGLGAEDAMIHLLNLIWPNIFETSPHVIDRMIEAIDAIRVCVGVGTVMNYTWAGLFHPARKVRTPYWRVYNEAYVQSADAMVPYYPSMPEEKGMDRKELMLML